MRSLEIYCVNPGCREILIVPEQFEGRLVRCAKCKCQFIVPFAPDKTYRLKSHHTRRRRVG